MGLGFKGLGVGNQGLRGQGVQELWAFGFWLDVLEKAAGNGCEVREDDFPVHLFRRAPTRTSLEAACREKQMRLGVLAGPPKCTSWSRSGPEWWVFRAY